MARLRILSGPQQVAPFEIAQTNTTIGRAKANIWRLEHRSVSKYHALIIIDDDGHLLFDLDSTNGTFLNNQRISSAPLKHGDHLRLGEFVIAYETTDQPAVAETPAAPKLAPEKTIAPRPALRRESDTTGPAAAAAPATAAAPASAPPPPPPPPPPPATPKKVTADVQVGPKPATPIKPSEQSGKVFIRLPGEKKATSGQRATGLVSKVLGREPAAAPAKPQPAPPMAPAPASKEPSPPAAPPPVEPPPPPAAQPAPPPQPTAAPTPAADKPIAVTPSSAPGEEKIIQKPSTGADQGEKIIVKPGAGGEPSGNKILLRPGPKKGGEITLKRPGAPKAD